MAPNGSNERPAPKDILSYSDLQIDRLSFDPPLPNVLESSFKHVSGPPTSSVGHPEEIAKLFPSLFGQPSVHFAPEPAHEKTSAPPLRLGVVLSGGQAPGGHNVIAGIFDFLQKHATGSKLYGFKGGPGGIMKNKYIEITGDYLYPYRNQGGFDIIGSGRDKIETPEQFAMARESCESLNLDGLVVIGGDDSNTNACLLAEYFRECHLKTRVVGCPKTIDGDLKAKQVPCSFGFDTACKIFSETIGNIMIDSRSAGKYYHFIRLMGRAASHITLECALQTHPNITLIGEEVFEKKQTLGQITAYISDVVTERASKGKNYGVVLIPEGLIDFVPEINILISELNDILAKGKVDPEGRWKAELSESSRHLFESMPSAIQDQLLLERDPHGNVQVAKIETEKMLITMVETELAKRKSSGAYSGSFSVLAHFCGYEGRCGLPTNFDSVYCYALGQTAAALIQAGQTGLIASVGNLTESPKEWTAGGTPLTQLMTVERRKGKNKPVIQKAMVELDGAPYKKFASLREKWAIEDLYRSPGPIQYYGKTADQRNLTLLLESGVEI